MPFWRRSRINFRSEHRLLSTLESFSDLSTNVVLFSDRFLMRAGIGFHARIVFRFEHGGGFVLESFSDASTDRFPRSDRFSIRAQMPFSSRIREIRGQPSCYLFSPRWRKWITT